MASKYYDGAPKTRIIEGKRYTFVGIDLDYDDIKLLKKRGYSVRSVYNSIFRERYYYKK